MEHPLSNNGIMLNRIKNTDLVLFLDKDYDAILEGVFKEKDLDKVLTIWDKYGGDYFEILNDLDWINLNQIED